MFYSGGEKWEEGIRFIVASQAARSIMLSNDCQTSWHWFCKLVWWYRLEISMAIMVIREIWLKINFKQILSWWDQWQLTIFAVPFLIQQPNCGEKKIISWTKKYKNKLQTWYWHTLILCASKPEHSLGSQMCVWTWWKIWNKIQTLILNCITPNKMTTRSEEKLPRRQLSLHYWQSLHSVPNYESLGAISDHIFPINQLIKERIWLQKADEHRL